MSFVDDVTAFKEVVPQLFEFVLGLGENVSDSDVNSAKELVENTRKKIEKMKSNIEAISGAMKKVNRVYSIALATSNSLGDAMVTYWDKPFPHDICFEMESRVASIEKQLKEFDSNSVEGILLGKLKMLADEIDDIWSKITVANSNQASLDKRNIHLEYLKDKLIGIKTYESIASEKLIDMLAVVAG